MNRNDIFRTFLNDPLLDDEVNKLKMDKKKINLYTELNTGILKVIQTAVNNLDEHSDSDKIARRINKLFTNI